MNAPATIAKTDCPILTLMPGLSAEEYQQRRRIQSVRNIMTAKIPELQPGHALQIAWIAIETATLWLFAPADLETITEVAEQCRRLMIVSDTAADLEGRTHG